MTELEKLEKELFTIKIRLNGIMADMKLKESEGDSLYKREVALKEKIRKLKYGKTNTTS